MLHKISSKSFNPDNLAAEISEALASDSALDNPTYYRVYHNLKCIDIS